MSTEQPIKKMAAISIFPEMFRAVTEFGVVGKAFSQNLLSLDLYNPRDYARDKHRTVDDRPYGGGAGMLMMPDPLKGSLEASRSKHPDGKVVYLSPQGRRLDQSYLEELGGNDDLIFLCGRYEGVDERFIERYVDEECSLGDYVISGGELACMVLIDALARLIPGVCGDYDSVKQDSFYSGILDYPNYTRPEVFEGGHVPKVLLSGNHEKIRAWREKQAFERTQQRRPDLIKYRANPAGSGE